MSTNRSVGRLTATREKARITATQEKVRAAATQDKVRTAATPINDRSALKQKQKKDRSGLCAFTFADGRQCRTPRHSRHLHLCYFHAQKEAQSLAAQQVGEDISRFLPAKLLNACDLGAAMARVFRGIAQGQIKPKLASTLAYLSQSMLQSVPLARHEFCEAFGSEAWRREIRSSFYLPAPQPNPAPPHRSGGLQAGTAPQPASPSPQPPNVVAGLQTGQDQGSQTAPAEQPPEPQSAQTPVNSCSQLTARHSPLPSSPHSPLPPTGAEFAKQVLADLPIVSSPATPHVQPPPPSPQPAETPTNCHSERSEEPAASSPNSPLATHHSPLPNAPANWDVLIPPKPRRRFSRHWQFLE